MHQGADLDAGRRRVDGCPSGSWDLVTSVQAYQTVYTAVITFLRPITPKSLKP